MPRPAFEIDLLVHGPPQQVWDRLWDLRRHTAAVPLTRVRREQAPGGRVAEHAPLDLGATFTARTGLGPLAVDDVMVVQEWEPPRHAVVVKTGRVLRGTIEVTLRPAGRDTRLRWVQTYGVPVVPDTLAGVVHPAVRAAYTRTLRQITTP